MLVLTRGTNYQWCLELSSTILFQRVHPEYLKASSISITKPSYCYSPSCTSYPYEGSLAHFSSALYSTIYPKRKIICWVWQPGCDSAASTSAWSVYSERYSHDFKLSINKRVVFINKVSCRELYATVCFPANRRPIYLVGL